MQLLEARLGRHAHALRAVAGIVDQDVLLGRLPVDGLVAGGVLGRNHHLVAIVALLHPGAYSQLRLLKLVIVGRVNEIASLLEEVVQNLLGGLLIAGPHWQPHLG